MSFVSTHPEGLAAAARRLAAQNSAATQFSAHAARLGASAGSGGG